MKSWNLRGNEMKKELTKMKTQKMEDIERAAWYARLAFGFYQEKQTPPAVPEKSEPAFYVIP